MEVFGRMAEHIWNIIEVEQSNGSGSSSSSRENAHEPSIVLHFFEYPIGMPVCHEIQRILFRLLKHRKHQLRWPFRGELPLRRRRYPFTKHNYRSISFCLRFIWIENRNK